MHRTSVYWASKTSASQTLMSGSSIVLIEDPRDAVAGKIDAVGLCGADEREGDSGLVVAWGFEEG